MIDQRTSRWRAAWANWLLRHQHPISLILHAVAIPMLPLAGVLAVVQLAQEAWHLWWRPVLIFSLSYVLQWIGHRIEGNDMGEVILIKRMLGRPYVAIAPPRSKGDAARRSESLG